MKETVEIKLDVLTAQVESGMKKDELAKHYKISVVQMGKALKEAGLKIRKFHAPAFKLVTDADTAVGVAGSTVGAIADGPGPDAVVNAPEEEATDKPNVFSTDDTTADTAEESTEETTSDNATWTH